MFKLTFFGNLNATGFCIVKITNAQLIAVPLSATLALTSGRGEFSCLSGFLRLLFLLALARFDLASASTAGAAPRPIFFRID